MACKHILKPGISQTQLLLVSTLKLTWERIGKGTKKDVPYPHLEPLRKRSKRDAMRYPVIPIRGGKPIGFTYSFAQEDGKARPM